MANYQREDDRSIAQEVMSIKPNGCTCLVEVFETAEGKSVQLAYSYRCRVHYPETSALLRL